MSLVVNFVTHFCQLSLEQGDLKAKEEIPHYDVFKYINKSLPSKEDTEYLPKLIRKIKKKFKKSQQWVRNRIDYLIDNDYLEYLDGEYVKINILGNKTRKKIFETIQTFPGLYPNKIMTALDLGTGQFLYHLQVLKDYDLVKELVFGSIHAYGTAEVGDQKITIGMVVLKDSLREILTSIAESPIPPSISDLMDMTGNKRSSLSYSLKKLVKLKILKKTKQGRTNYYDFRSPFSEYFTESHLEFRRFFHEIN